MISDIPRLRMFAGPNGSGKSTIKSLLTPELLGVYINPDEIQYQIQKNGFINFLDYQVKTTLKEIAQFFDASILIQKSGLNDLSKELKMEEDKLYIPTDLINSYLASVLSDFMRQQLLDCKESFTFETVMSSPDKIEHLKNAKKSGFRTYLYYIATDDPLINISRIEHRVSSGGHSVPKEKIISRYHRSINLLNQAIACTDRAYIFDNSTHHHVLLAEVTNGSSLELKTDAIPAWFKNSLQEKFNL
jgi:predicted ABC-type ATPase